VDSEKLVCRSNHVHTLWLYLFAIVPATGFAWASVHFAILVGAMFVVVAGVNHVLYRYVYFSTLEVTGDKMLFLKESGSRKELPLSELHTIRRLRGGYQVHFEFKHDLIKTYIYVDRRVVSEISKRRASYLEGSKLCYYHSLIGPIQYV